jgi:colanic acid/amylovoran biosynthesis glycosyltransferase
MPVRASIIQLSVPKARARQCMLMLTMFHANPALIEGDQFVVDRKFLTGMQRYSEGIDSPLTTVHPRLIATETIMDRVSVPLRSLPYAVSVIEADWRWAALPHEVARLRALVANTKLAYYGFFDVSALCRELGVAEVLMLEHDLPTIVRLATAEAAHPLRRLVRGARGLRDFVSRIPAMRRAWSVHCNGYPVYEEMAHFNPRRRLLYLDSRMSIDSIIDEPALVQRLGSREPGKLRLVYSGRYEPIKGAVDVVRVGLEALRQGLDIELHTYGQGTQRDQMRSLAAAAGGRIQVHDAVPYPTLVELSRDFDVFVCCHVQSDPSCTYLESFGSGLPVVGYANRMWRGLRRESNAGMESPMGHPQHVVRALRMYSSQPQRLHADSLAARGFALHHSFEAEIGKRIDDLNAVLHRLQPTAASPVSANG